MEHADKAVRAPGESSQDATMLRDSTAEATELIAEAAKNGVPGNGPWW